MLDFALPKNMFFCVEWGKGFLRNAANLITVVELGLRVLTGLLRLKHLLASSSSMLAK